MNTGTKVTTGATTTTHEIDIHTAIMDVITDVWDRAKQINEATYEILDLIEANRKKFGRNDNDHCKRSGEPVAKVRDRGFEVVGGKHVPTVLVEFPVDDWESRDRFAAAVDAPQPLSESDMSDEPDLVRCAECGAEMIHVRPGKWQHPDCSQSSRAAEPEPCFCDRMYPDSNPDVSCGDCPTRDYKKPMKDSVDMDDLVAAFIARGDITKDAFLEARQWVRDTYYNPAEPVNMDLVRKWQAENGVKQDPDSREARMVVIRHDDDGKPTIWCDPEIADLVRALNDGGVETVGSCSGHGWRPGNIMLSDGRVLVICKDVDEAKGVVSHFPCINGEAPLDAEAVGGLSAEQLAEILSAYIKPEIIGEALEKLENAPWELSGPVKPHLTVKYDDKGDYLYICCDSNEPAEAEENDQGILLWRAYSDGRLVGVTIPNFIGPNIKPVKVDAEASVPSDMDIDELSREWGLLSAAYPSKSMVRDFARALLARYK